MWPCFLVFLDCRIRPKEVVVTWHREVLDADLEDGWVYERVSAHENDGAADGAAE